jgi:MFS family permease
MGPMSASTDKAGPMDEVEPRAGSSPWAPFRSPDFARMASAQFVSNVGSWMQTVGTQELMLTLTTSATLVALIQTAAGLPVVLLAVPAGAIGDLVDRRKLLIASQLFMLLAATLLAGLALAGLLTPLILLVLIFAVGAGQTLTSPTWQTLQPELVAAEDRTQAIALGAVNQNLSRAIGPAIGAAVEEADPGGLGVTCSFGVATSHGADVALEPLLKASDTALYAAKRAGRNRVELFNPRLSAAA